MYNNNFMLDKLSRQKEEIENLVHFQEKYFKSVLIK